LQVPRCKLNKKTVIRYRFTVLRAELQDLSSSLDDDLRSSLEGGGATKCGGCLFQRRASRVRDEERVRETGESSRLLVSEANASTVLFLDASYWSRKAETGLCEQTVFKIASCRRQPCVPGCFSGHCDLAKPALRPPMFFRRLASNFSSDWFFPPLVSLANLSILSLSIAFACLA